MLNNQDRITFLGARIARRETQRKVEIQYDYRENKVEGVILEDIITALTENNEADTEMILRYEV